MTTVYEYQFEIRAGTYEFFTYIRIAKHHFIYLYRKDIHVDSDTTININVNEANVLTEFKFYREDNSILRINSFGFRYILDPRTLLGVGYTHHNLDSTSFILEYNDLPDYFHNELACQRKAGLELG